MILLFSFAFCSNKLTTNRQQQKSVIDLINEAYSKGSKTENSLRYNQRVHEMRQKAVLLYGIETDTSRLKSFITIDWGNLEGQDFFGEMIVNDTAKYFYKGSYLVGAEVDKYNYPVTSEETIIKYLKEHRFKELEALAKNKGKSLSGSNFIYIGMYEKGMDSIYVSIIPAFMSN